MHIFKDIRTESIRLMRGELEVYLQDSESNTDYSDLELSNQKEGIEDFILYLESI